MLIYISLHQRVAEYAFSKMPLKHKDYFELQAIKKKPSTCLPKSRTRAVKLSSSPLYQEGQKSTTRHNSRALSARRHLGNQHINLTNEPSFPFASPNICHPRICHPRNSNFFSFVLLLPSKLFFC